MGSFAQGALLTQLTTTTTSSGTTLLTADSYSWQRFIGTNGEIVQLPDATTMKKGRYFTIQNRSAGLIVVETFGGSAEIAKVASGCQRDFYLYDNATSDGDWTASNQTDVDIPLGMFATRPDPDNLLNIRANQLYNADGSITSMAPADDLIQPYGDTTIDFQSASPFPTVNGGSVTTAGSTFTVPAVTAGEYVRMALVYQSAANSIDTAFSAASASLPGLTNPGTLFSTLTGVPLGYIDLESEGGFNFKTPGAPAGIIAPNYIYRFGSGAGSGAGGDTSFKIQSIGSDGTLTLKGGYLALSDGRILATYTGSGSSESSFGKDISFDIDALIASPTDSTTYYMYVDKWTLALSPTTVSDSGRELYPVTSSNFYLTTVDFENIDRSQYCPVGNVRRGVGVWLTGVALTFPTKRESPTPLGVDGSTALFMDYALIGSVGSASQIMAGHILASSSFPSTGTGLSYYNFAGNASDASGNARTLSPNGTIVYTGADIFGVSQSPTLNGTNAYFSYNTDSQFDPGPADFIVGGWFKPSSWSTGSYALFSQWNTSTPAKSFLAAVESGILNIYATSDGTTNQNPISTSVSSLSGWHHVALKYVASTKTFTVYIDGAYIVDGVHTGNLYQAAANKRFNLGAYNNASYFFTGELDEFFFHNGSAYADNAVSKIFAAKLTHSKTLGSNQQNWDFWVKSSAGQARPLEYTPIIEMGPNDLWYDLSQEASTNYISWKMKNEGQVGASKPSRGNTLYMTTDVMDGIMPFNHGLGLVPYMDFKAQNGSNDWEGFDWGSYFVVTNSQIKLAGDTLVNLIGTGVNVMLTYATGLSATFVPNKLWNSYTVTGATGAAANDRVIADTSGSSFTVALPASPSLGTEIQFCDAKGVFGTNPLTIGRNGQNIMGAASDFIANISHKMYRAIYVDATYGWAIYF